MLTERNTPIRTAPSTADVEALLEPVEADGVFRDSRECAGAVLLAGLVLLAPPTPRPKPQSR